MPRTLPWLADPARTAPPAHAPPTTSSPHIADAIPPSHAEPSPSHGPAASVSTGPKQEEMYEGYSKDDRWMMVEDEFLSTAQIFTAHLHRAEYERLRRQAEELEAEMAVGNKGSAVAGFVPCFRSKAARAKRFRDDQEDIDSGEEDGDRGKNGSGWTAGASTGLAGLMDSPKRKLDCIKRYDASGTAKREASPSEGHRIKRESTVKPLQDPEVKQESKPMMAQQDVDMESDSDLDGPVRDTQLSYRAARDKIASPAPAQKTIMARFTNRPPSSPAIRAIDDRTVEKGDLLSGARVLSGQSKFKAPLTNIQAEENDAPKRPAIPIIDDFNDINENNARIAQMLANRRAKAKAKAQDQAEQEVKQEAPEMPTFLY